MDGIISNQVWNLHFSALHVVKYWNSQQNINAQKKYFRIINAKYIPNINTQKKYKMKICLAVQQYNNGTVLEADFLVCFTNNLHFILRV